MANNSVMINEPKSTLDATQRVVKILDAKYEKADLNAVVADNCKHLCVPDQEKLLKLLTDFKDLFDGRLGDWDTEPVSLKLKEGTKTISLQAISNSKNPQRNPEKRDAKAM